MLIKDINLFERYKEVQRREKNVSKSSAIKVLIIGCIIIGTVVSTSAIRILQVDMDKEISTIDEFLNSGQVTENLDVITEKLALLDNATNYYKTLKSASDNIYTEVKLSRELIEGLTKILPANTELRNFSYISGSLNINCISDSEGKIANYVHRLRSLDPIYKVSYTGYTQETGESYYADMIITFKPGGEGNE